LAAGSFFLKNLLILRLFFSSPEEEEEEEERRMPEKTQSGYFIVRFAISSSPFVLIS
jgi:hypothetical protein